MGLLDTFIHLLNFCAPAFSMAVLMPALVRVSPLRKSLGPLFAKQSVVLFGACLAVLVVGLWVFGQDGKMATYIVMVLVCATTQWVMQRAWKA